MKKKFKLIDLDCANCAAKMEEAIRKIDGVTDASVSFMTQKMMIEADDAVFDQVVEENISLLTYIKVCRFFEYNVVVQIHEQFNEKTEKRSDKDHNSNGYVRSRDDRRACGTAP